MRVTTYAVTLALVGASFVVMPAPAGAEATVFKDGTCIGFIPTPEGTFGALLYGEMTKETTSKSGVINLTCHFDIPAGQEPAGTTRASGFMCGTYAGPVTLDSTMTATSSGQAKLVCRVRP